MKCINCGFEHPEPFQFCPGCGADNRYSAPVNTPPNNFYSAPVNTAAEKMLWVLKDNLFLVICILLSISCGFSIISGSIPLFNVLITIFLWITYNQSRKNIVDSKQLKNVSGTVFTMYVLNFVLFGLFILIGLIFAIVFILIASEPEIHKAFIGGFYEGLQISGISPDQFESMLGGYIDIASFASVIGWIFFFVFLISGTIGILINALGMGKIRRFAKSTYKSLENGFLSLEKVNAAKNWLIVFGVFSAISALSTLASGSFFSAVAVGTESAVMITASVLIKKYFVSQQY